MKHEKKHDLSTIWFKIISGRAEIMHRVVFRPRSRSTSGHEHDSFT
jgi:hypothetical protein